MASRYGSGVSATTTALSTLFTASTLHRAWLEVAVQSAAQAFTGLTIEGRVNRDDTSWTTLASVALDYTAPSGPIYRASEDLTTMAAATRGTVTVETTGHFEIRVRVSTAAADSVTWNFNVD